MKQISSNEFTSEVLESPIPIIADFFAEYCGPCRSLSPLLEEAETSRSGTLKVVKIDASAESGLAAAFRVTTLPTVILFQGGEPVAQFVGGRSKSELERWIEDSLRRQ